MDIYNLEYLAKLVEEKILFGGGIHSDITQFPVDQLTRSNTGREITYK